jgi:hypothetical protein
MQNNHFWILKENTESFGTLRVSVSLNFLKDTDVRDKKNFDNTINRLLALHYLTMLYQLDCLTLLVSQFLHAL